MELFAKLNGLCDFPWEFFKNKQGLVFVVIVYLLGYLMFAGY